MTEWSYCSAHTFNCPHILMSLHLNVRIFKWLNDPTALSIHLIVHILKCQEIQMTDWSCCSALTIDYLNPTNDCLTLLNWTDWFCSMCSTKSNSCTMPILSNKRQLTEWMDPSQTFDSGESKALSLLAVLQKPDFIASMVCLSKFMGPLHIPTINLQKRELDIMKAYKLLESTIKVVFYFFYYQWSWNLVQIGTT